MTLSDMKPGDRATVISVAAGTEMRRRLLDIGFSEKETVECVGISPLGDPLAYRILGAVVAIRRRDGQAVSVQKTGVTPWA